MDVDTLTRRDKHICINIYPETIVRGALFLVQILTYPMFPHMIVVLWQKQWHAHIVSIMSANTHWIWRIRSKSHLIKEVHIAIANLTAFRPTPAHTQARIWRQMYARSTRMRVARTARRIRYTRTNVVMLSYELTAWTARLQQCSGDPSHLWAAYFASIKQGAMVWIKVAIILCTPQESDLLISDGIRTIYSKIKAEDFFSLSF